MLDAQRQACTCCKLARHHMLHCKNELHTREGSGSRVEYLDASPQLQPVVLHKLPTPRFPDCQTSSPAPLNQMGACHVATRTVMLQQEQTLKPFHVQHIQNGLVTITFSFDVVQRDRHSCHGHFGVGGNTALTAWVLVCPCTCIASNIHK